MTKILLKSLLAGSASCAALLAISSAAFAGQSTNAEAAQALMGVGTQTAAPASATVAPVASQPTLMADASLERVNRYAGEGIPGGNVNPMAQVTSVSQLSDVKPTDWAFAALQSLVEKYGCIVGYPDRTFRGQRALSRYEFAAGLNACMDRMSELIASATADLVKKEDLAVLQKLQEEFAAELATLRGRVDALEAKTAQLEAQQFSTTTKLVGEAIFALTGEFGGRSSSVTIPAPAGADPDTLGNLPGGADLATYLATVIPGTVANPSVARDTNPVFQNRVRLNFNTSFTGKDLLVSRIAAGSARPFPYQAGLGDFTETTQTFNYVPGPNNTAAIDWVAYYFPIGDKASFYVPAFAGLWYDQVPTLNPYLDGFDGGNAALSIFGQRNPIYSIGGGSGAVMNYTFNPMFKGSIGYLADNSGNGGNFAGSFPGRSDLRGDGGQFGGSYSAMVQLTITPSEKAGVGLTYVNAYRAPGTAIFDAGAGAGAIGSPLANGIFDIYRRLNFGTEVSAGGISGYYKVTPRFAVSAFGMYATANYTGAGSPGADGEIWSYGLGFSFPDLGKKGSLGGLVIGAQPYLSNVGQVISSYPLAGGGVIGAAPGLPNEIPIHVEAFYKYQLTDNISITPGVIWISNPYQSAAVEDAFVGTIRTTFSF